MTVGARITIAAAVTVILCSTTGRARATDAVVPPWRLEAAELDFDLRRVHLDAPAPGPTGGIAIVAPAAATAAAPWTPPAPLSLGALARLGPDDLEADALEPAGPEYAPLAYVLDGPDDIGKALTFMVSGESVDLWLIAALATGAAIALDGPVTDELERHAGRDALARAEEYGGGQEYLIAGGVGAAAGMVSGNRWLTQTSLRNLESIAVGGGLANLIKLAGQEVDLKAGERPSGENRNGLVSGHAAASWAMGHSLVLSTPPDLRLLVALGAYGWAGLVSAARMADESHSFGQTVAGAALGVIAAEAVHRVWQNKPHAWELYVEQGEVGGEPVTRVGVGVAF